MSLTSEEMEVRIPAGSLTYEPLANNDHIQPPNQTAQQERSRGPAGAPNSTGSKPSAVVLEARYRECLKNHAANTGGNVTDGCGEFMPSGDAGTVEAFTCAACNCHRNFHRKEINAADTIIVHQPPVPPPSLPSPLMNHHHHSVVEPVPLRGNHWTAGMVQPVKMAFGGGCGGSGTESSTEEVYYTTYQSQSVQPPPQYVLAKKRHRTKFMPEQKEKMLAFAEKLGWRIPREDDIEVQRFCAEVGVKRHVFKVWMHNNKISGKKNSEENHEI